MKVLWKSDRGAQLTVIGAAVMALLTLTKVVPSSTIAGYSVFVGIAFFFLVEAVEKTRDAQSGLRFSTLPADLRKKGVLFWMLMPLVSALLTLAVGYLLFQRAFVDHVMGRTSGILSFEKLPLLVIQVVLAALGEEIAFRGFLTGKSMRLFPFWGCAAASSVVFAAGHIAQGSAGLVLFDVCTIFIDSVLYAVIYRKSGNCLVSTIAHILCNAAGIACSLILF